MVIDAVLNMARSYNANVIAGMASSEGGDNGILLAAIGIKREGREEPVIEALNAASLVPVQLATDEDEVPSFPEADNVAMTLYQKVGNHIVVNASGLENVATLNARLNALTDAFSNEG